MPTETMIKKQFVSSEIKVDDNERTVTAVISTGTVDRDREVVVAKGGDFTNYLKNPVVLFAHDYRELPIAKALWLTQKGSKITAKAQFADTVMAEDVYQLYKGGFLKAFSIGFIPNKRHQPSPKEIEKRPELANVWSVIDEWELLEFSAVPVPANPEALMQAVKTKEITLSSDEVVNEFDFDDDEEKFYVADVIETVETPDFTKTIEVELDVTAKDYNVTIPVTEAAADVNVDEIVSDEKKRHKGIVY